MSDNIKWIDYGSAPLICSARGHVWVFGGATTVHEPMESWHCQCGKMTWGEAKAASLDEDLLAFVRRAETLLERVDEASHDLRKLLGKLQERIDEAKD